MNIFKIIFGKKKEEPEIILEEKKEEVRFFLLYRGGLLYGNESIIVLDKEKQIYFNVESNEYIDKDHHLLRSIDERYITKITEKEFNNYIESANKSFECNCKVGDGLPDIEVVKTYSGEEIEEIYNNSQHEYLIKFDKENTEKCIDFYEIVFMSYEKDSEHIYPIHTFNIYLCYKRKACIKCETCLDDKNKMIQDITNKINAIVREQKKKQERLDKAELICKANE